MFILLACYKGNLLRIFTDDLIDILSVVLSDWYDWYFVAGKLRFNYEWIHFTFTINNSLVFQINSLVRNDSKQISFFTEYILVLTLMFADMRQKWVRDDTYICTRCSDVKSVLFIVRKYFSIVDKTLLGLGYWLCFLIYPLWPYQKALRHTFKMVKITIVFILFLNQCSY